MLLPLLSLPPVLFLLLFQVFCFAVIAEPVMAGDVPIARRALPFLFLLREELVYPHVSDIPQILYHAQVVSGTVTLIEGLEALAGKYLTGIAVLYSSLT
jgi:hypothetical protein